MQASIVEETRAENPAFRRTRIRIESRLSPWEVLLIVTLPSVFLVVYIFLTIFGVGCLIWIWSAWKTSVWNFGDLWPKIITKTIQLISGFGSLFATYSFGARKEEWLSAVIWGVICIAVWEIVGQLIDHRVKARDKVDRKALERAEFQSNLRTMLLTVFRFAVDGKASRIRRHLELSRRKLGISQVRNALTPQRHLGELLQNLAVFFQKQLADRTGANRNFRVGVYLEVEGAMTPVQALSLNDSSYTPFRSHQNHRSAFQLSSDTNPSHIVICVRRRQTIVVEDCVKAADQGDFFFFTEDQRSYLRSMVVFYLGEVGREDGTMVHGVLAVDTEAAGFFRESDRDSIEFCLREFAGRLRLEMLLIALLVPKGASA